MTPDAHPLIGRLEPLRNAYIAAGFSGHGFMHGPIAGKLLSEIMLDGHPHTIADLSALSPNRFGQAPAVREYNVI
jgi:glycine/D-amino acid oxidase-like deaminating enzyme